MILKIKGDRGEFTYIFADEIVSWKTFGEPRMFRIEIDLKNGHNALIVENKEIQNKFIQHMINPKLRRAEGVINMYLDKK